MFNPGKTTIVTVDDKAWTVGRLERSVLFAFRDWIKTQVGDPFATVERVKTYIGGEALLGLVKEAEGTVKDLQSFSLGTATGKAFISSETGMSKLIQLMLLKAHPDATEDDAFRIVMHWGAEAVAKAVADAAGKVPGGNGQAGQAMEGSIGAS